jgi:hypothetical protein
VTLLVSDPLNVVVVMVGAVAVGLGEVVDDDVVGAGAGPAPPRAASVAAASTRPYATTDPMFTADDSMPETTCAAVADGASERARPARPATTGVAADVPQNEELYPPPRLVA